MIELREYVDTLGRSPFGRWYERVEENTRARITVALDRLSRGSLTAKGVGEGVMEMRMDFGPGYRVYFGRGGEGARDSSGRGHQAATAKRYRNGSGALA